jgi:hypothetical protein
MNAVLDFGVLWPSRVTVVCLEPSKELWKEELRAQRAAAEDSVMTQSSFQKDSSKPLLNYLPK